MNNIAIVLAAVLIAANAHALPRDSVQLYTFKKHNPCPVTGKSKGPCKGWQVDHIQPLMTGGADHPSNMRWITTEDHRAKTRQDIADCKAGPVCLHRKYKRQTPAPAFKPAG